MNTAPCTKSLIEKNNTYIIHFTFIILRSTKGKLNIDINRLGGKLNLHQIYLDIEYDIFRHPLLFSKENV